MPDIKLILRLGAIGVTTLAIVIAAFVMRGPGRPAGPAGPDQPRNLDSSVDPLRAELRRCNAIGTDAGNDRACLAAWAENRRRFLGAGARSADGIDPAPEPATSGGVIANRAVPAEN